MTIKTESLLLERESNISRPVAMMQKSGAVKNLFGLKPDQKQLQQHHDQQNEENMKKLNGYMYTGLIGVVMNPPDQAKRLKRQLSVQSESDDDDDSSPSPLLNPTHSFQQNLCNAGASSSVAAAPSSASSLSPSSSTDAPELPSSTNGSPRIAPRRRGQQTITSYFHVIKRGKKDRCDPRKKR